LIPSGGEGDEHDERGIIGAGVDEADHGWVLVDASGHYSPGDWARGGDHRLLQPPADRLVAEANSGGEMIESVLRSVDPNVPVSLVHAPGGKGVRAEPIAALYEQNRVITSAASRSSRTR
jgi:phage terminase large subunit-like protein